MKIDNRYYDSLGEAWWDPNGPMRLLLHINRFRYRYYRSVLEEPKGMMILDVGCGGGFLAEAFATDGAHVYGLDLSPNSVRTTREHVEKQGLCVRVVSGRAECLPYASGVFDVVLLADVLEHLEDFKTAIAESSRVLRQGGILLYETVNRTLFSRIGAIWILEYVLRKIPHHSHDWRMFIKPRELLHALETCNLHNRELRGLAFKDGVLGFLLRSVTGQDPWVFTTGSDTRAMYMGYAIKSG